MKLVATTDYFFGKLFTIHFLHSRFDDLTEAVISENLSLLPDDATKALFANYHINCSFEGSTFICFIQGSLLAAPALQPRGAFIIPAAGTRFRFLLKASTLFMNSTVVEPVANGHVYHFGNRVSTASGMFISHDAGDVNNNDLDNLADVDPKESYLGVIDIFSSGAVNSSYELFSGGLGQLQGPEYQLQFKSSN